MKYGTIAFCFLLSGFVFSCNKPCGDCETAPLWNDSTAYAKNAVVKYNNECYKALTEGDSTTPGPWKANTNTQWVDCQTF